MRKMLESFKQIKFKNYTKFLIIFCSVFVFGFAFDQASKYIAEACLKDLPNQSHAFIPGFLDFVLIYNKGAAWGMGDGQDWSRILLAVISWVVMFFIIGYIFYSMGNGKKFDTFYTVTLGLILAGDVGNLIDRTFFYDRGVIDFLSIQSWFPGFGIFNIADSCLVIGMFMFLGYLFYEEYKEKKKEKLENEKAIAAETKVSESAKSNDVVDTLTTSEENKTNEN